MRYRRLTIRRGDGRALGGALTRLSKTRGSGRRRRRLFRFFFNVVVIAPIVAIVVLHFCLYPFPRLGTINVGLISGRRARRPMRRENRVLMGGYCEILYRGFTKGLGLHWRGIPAWVDIAISAVHRNESSPCNGTGARLIATTCRAVKRSDGIEVGGQLGTGRNRMYCKKLEWEESGCTQKAERLQ